MGLELDQFQGIECEVQPHVFLGNDIIPDLSDDISTMPADKLVLKNVLSAAIESLPSVVSRYLHYITMRPDPCER